MTGLREARRAERREAIIAFARPFFMENGFAATSMSAIAAGLGGSKTTLWTYFPSKEDLYAAVLKVEIRQFNADLFTVLTLKGDLRDTLRQFCLTLMRGIFSHEGLMLIRLIAAESERFPEIGRVFYEEGPQQGALRLGAFLGEGMERGELRTADPSLAAQQLIHLCEARLLMQSLSSIVQSPPVEEIAADVELALETFFRAYAPPISAA